MHIAHLSYDMRIGGTEQVIMNIVQGDWPKGVRHSIICIEQPIGPFGQQMQAAGIHIHAFTRKDGFDFHLIKDLRQFIQSQEIDILHCHQYTPWSYGALACIGLTTKIIFTEHGRFYPDVKHPKRRLVNPVLSYFTDAITSISEATKTALIEYEYINPHKIQVIYNGIHKISKPEVNFKEMRKNLGISNNTFILGTIARFDPIKNHLMMLDAVHMLLCANKDVHLIIVGDGETRPLIEKRIDELDISNQVTLTGYIAKPSEYMALFDLYLLTSFSEGTSMTLLEAMCMEQACVVTNVGGNPEVIEDGFNGRVIPSDNPQSLSDTIAELLDNSLLLESYRRNALTRFLECFESKSMNDAFAALYNRLQQ